MNMKQEQRLKIILDSIGVDQKVTTNMIQKRTNLALSTIYRDLDKLESDNKIVREYGSIKKVQSFIEFYDQNTHQFKDEKLSLAKKAAKIIKSNSTIFLSGGYTCENILNFIANKSNIHIITNSISILSNDILNNNKNITIELIPGKYSFSRKIVLSEQSIDYIQKFKFDNIFISCYSHDNINFYSLNIQEQAFYNSIINNNELTTFLVVKKKKYKTSNYIITKRNNIKINILES